MYVEFNQVDTFTAGALGEPGQRIFLLQCIAAGQRVTVKCEKQQAQAIAAYLRRVLADVVEPGQELTGVTDPIGPPFDPVFVLGQVGLGYLPDEQRVLVQLDEAGAVDEQGELVSDPALSCCCRCRRRSPSANAARPRLLAAARCAAGASSRSTRTGTSAPV